MIFEWPKTLAELAALDFDELYDGYREGRESKKDDPEPAGNRGRSYWVGWHNGRVDAYLDEPSPEQMDLARQFVLAQQTESAQGETKH